MRIILTSAEVIHSFWVPQLQGKLDVIPGDTNDLRLSARRPGQYTGACAEYCGAHHAHMGLTVVAEDPIAFRDWAARELTGGLPPRDSLALEGQRLFVGGPCSLCHTVRGTSAVAQISPDLTHVGSRLTIAAGTLPNTLGNLEGWIANPRSLKPGTKMPTLSVYDGAELRALAAYVSVARIDASSRARRRSRRVVVRTAVIATNARRTSNAFTMSPRCSCVATAARCSAANRARSAWSVVVAASAESRIRPKRAMSVSASCHL